MTPWYRAIPSPTDHSGRLPTAVSAVLVQTRPPQDFHTSAMTHVHLQLRELGGSTKKTLWQLCQLVGAERPVELIDQTRV